MSPHAHIDYLWCDTADGMGAKTAKIIKHTLLLMRKYPEYKFVIDGVMSIEYFKLHYPKMLDELRQRVKENRIELIGGMIVAPDTLMPNGESLVRQVLYGINYIKENFGIIPKIAYLIDSFGQTPQLPQILKKAGFEYFIFWRGANNRLLPSEFYWRAPDGSKILTHWLYRSYTWLVPPFTATILPPIFPFAPVPLTLNFIPQNFKVYEILKKVFPPIKYFIRFLNRFGMGVEIIGADMTGGLKFTIKRRLERATTNNIFILNGTDNLPPSSNIIDVVRDYQKNSMKFNVKIALPSEFLKTIKNSGKKFGIIGPYEFSGLPDKFPGTYSNRIRLKQKIRSLENLFYLTELFASLAKIYEDKEYPLKSIQKAIIRILCCDFHDGICGCCVDAAYNQMLKMLKLSELQLSKIYRHSIQSLINIIDTSDIPKNSIPIIIFNPLSFSRTDIARIHCDFKEGSLKIIDDLGHEIPFQKDNLSESGKDYIFIAKDIPSIGYKLFYIMPTDSKNIKAKNNSNEIITNLNKESDFKQQIEAQYRCNNELITLENDRFILTFENNKLLSIKDKKHEFTIRSSEFYINDLRIHSDRSDSYLHSKTPKKFGVTYSNSLEIIEQGPVRTVIRIISKLKCPGKLFSKQINQIIQYIILYNFNIPRIDFITEFKNKIKNCRIQACFPVNFKAPKFHSEVPYGFYQRDIKPSIGKSWEEFKKRFAHYDRIFPVINWMDASSLREKKGISIINYGLPEYEIGENRDYIFLTLLKSTGYIATLFPGAVPMVLGPFYSIPKAFELAEQKFHYSIYFHNGDFKEHNLPKISLSHNIHLITERVRAKNTILPKKIEFIKIEPNNFIINAVKMSENNTKEMIIRVLETSNKISKGRIKFDKEIETVHLVNLLEEPIKKLKILSGNAFEFDSKPQEILTFSIKFK
ncbi:MAG: glycosyl hydrolase-related protein [Promethearchaeota archaeon]